LPIWWGKRIATTLTNAIRTSKIAPAYLFTVPEAPAKLPVPDFKVPQLSKSDKPTEQPLRCVLSVSANGSALDVIEIDASKHRGGKY